MKIKINVNNDELYCLYSKERIEIGDKYLEVVEDYLDDEIIKTYAFWHLDAVVDEYIDEHNQDPEIDYDI